MPRAHSDSGRIELRLRPEDKAVLTRAATLERLDLTAFILRNVFPQAAAVIAREEHLQLSERDSLRVLELLENPPAAPARLVRAATAGFPLEGRACPGRSPLSQPSTPALPSTAATPISISICNAPPAGTTTAAAPNVS